MLGMFWVRLVGLDRLMPSINKCRLLRVVSLFAYC